jgi:hypothetical protein
VKACVGVSCEAAAVFKQSTTGALAEPNLNQPGFNSPHRAYNAAIEEDLGASLEERALPPAAMSAADAEQFVARVRSSQDPVVSAFLDDVEAAAQRNGTASSLARSARSIGKVIPGLAIGLLLLDAWDYARTAEACDADPCSCGAICG